MEPLFDGTRKTIAGKDFIIPPLSLGQLKKLGPELKAMGQAPQEEQIALMGRVIHLALSRNYPTISVEEVDDMIDLGNIAEVFQAVVNVSGLERQTKGEAVGTGTVQ